MVHPLLCFQCSRLAETGEHAVLVADSIQRPAQIGNCLRRILLNLSRCHLRGRLEEAEGLRQIRQVQSGQCPGDNGDALRAEVRDALLPFPRHGGREPLDVINLGAGACAAPSAHKLRDAPKRHRQLLGEEELQQVLRGRGTAGSVHAEAVGHLRLQHGLSVTLELGTCPEAVGKALWGHLLEHHGVDLKDALPCKYVGLLAAEPKLGDSPNAVGEALDAEAMKPRSTCFHNSIRERYCFLDLEFDAVVHPCEAPKHVRQLLRRELRKTRRGQQSDVADDGLDFLALQAQLAQGPHHTHHAP
mmetsp:Transcript_107375/g.256507  ORF Transcript_107375/g.256507 Transcript_107375/m.256507 type:complete len:302 (+) Transcript_107375:727-1632(+)